MSRILARTKPRWWDDKDGEPSRSVPYLIGGVTLTAFYLVAHGLLPRHASGGATPALQAGQSVHYRAIPALLTQARDHDSLLRLPHARWFARIRHGHAQIVVVDNAPLRASASAAGGGGRS